MSASSIEGFLDTYAERYMASDADAITAMCDVPFLAVREGRAIHLGDPAAVRAHFAALMEAYRNAGATRATIMELHVTQLGSTSVVATVRWNAHSADGSLLRDFVTSYQMLRDDAAGWRILSYTYHDRVA